MIQCWGIQPLTLAIKQCVLLGILTSIITALQAATILVAMASGKNFCDQNNGESRQLATNRIKEKLTWKIINNRMNLINSTSAGITCLSLFPSGRSETWHECVKWSVENMPFRRISPSCNISWSVLPVNFLFLARCNMSWSVLPFAFFLATEYFLWRPLNN